MHNAIGLVKRCLFVVLFILYPLIVYWGLHRGEIFWVGLFLFAVSAIEAVRKKTAITVSCAVATGLLGVLSYEFSSSVPLRIYPVLINLAWFLFWLQSLTTVPMVERFARMRHPNLTSAERRYCRTVTLCWCVFFLINGVIALDSAWNRSLEWWTFYNGFLSYILIGVMFAAEWTVRFVVARKMK